VWRPTFQTVYSRKESLQDRRRVFFTVADHQVDCRLLALEASAHDGRGQIVLDGERQERDGKRMMTPGLVAYAATKGAIKMFAQGLAREVGDRGITVNNIQPGPIDTDLNPASGDWAAPQKALTALNRYGSVDDVASLVAFVASPDAAYITGASLTVDGGTNA